MTRRLRDGWCGDALAEKYAGWSPYNYVLNNPVNAFDPDGNKVVLGSKFERLVFIASVFLSNGRFAYKTENLKYVEAAAQRLQQSETGKSLYDELDAIEQEIIVEVGDLPATNREIQLGNTQPTGDLSTNEFQGATVTLESGKYY